jgi:hypothetical protein
MAAVVAASVAVASGAVVSFAATSGAAASTAAASGIADSGAADCGAVISSSFVVMGFLSSIAGKCRLCVWSKQMAAGTPAARGESAMPHNIFKGRLLLGHLLGN